MLLKVDTERTLVEATYHQVIKSKFGEDNTVVATDASEILQLCQDRHIPCVMTSETHQSGSDRVAEVVHAEHDLECVVNVQGDEPFINPSFVDKTVEGLLNWPQADFSTVALRMTTQHDMHLSSVVKVVCDQKSHAMYFSRSPVPFNVDGDAQEWLRHVGIYAFRPAVLKSFCAHPPSMLERSERLEQLRLLEMGYKCLVIQVDKDEHVDIAVDTLQDLQRARDWFRSHGQ